MPTQPNRWPVRLGEYLRDEPSGSLWRVKGFSSEARKGDEARHNLYVTLELAASPDSEDLPPEVVVRLGKVVLYLHNGRLTVEETAEPEPVTAELTLEEGQEWEDFIQE
jgi:hypothetical protein